MRRRAVVFIIFVIVLVTVYLLSRDYLTWELVIAREAELRSALDQRPWTGFGIGFLIYVGVSMIPGTTGKAIIAGWLYGFWVGLVMVNIGLTLAALMGFAIGRYFCLDLVTSRLGPRLARANDALAQEGPGYLFVARVLHVPYCLTNYVMGATRIRLGGFWWATQLGLLPGNLLFVYAGSQAPTLGTLQEEGLMSLLSPGVIVAFVAVSVLPLLIRALVSRIVVALRHRR
jgi:uncharacterized membrane protein YdjX (TVP38/TMEM64 family)